MKFVGTIFLLCVLAFAMAGQSVQPTEHPGIQLYKQGKYSEAARTLSLAVKDKFWRSNASLWNYLGLSYAAQNNFSDARKPMEKAVEFDQNSSTYHINLAFVYLMLRQSPKAFKEAGKAIALDPKNA